MKSVNFVSDIESFTTVDTVNGYQLVQTWAGPEGLCRFELRNGDTVLCFSANRVTDAESVTWTLFNVGTDFDGRMDAREVRATITAALQSFGFLYGRWNDLSIIVN
jgi:hypothetical protein